MHMPHPSTHINTSNVTGKSLWGCPWRFASTLQTEDGSTVMLGTSREASLLNLGFGMYEQALVVEQA